MHDMIEEKHSQIPAAGAAPMLRDYWHIALAGSRLGKGPTAVRLLDQDLVLFRDVEGRAHALLDRCCHRGVRLSLGKVTDEGRLACGYHGWEYGGDGRCLHVPSLPAGQRVSAAFQAPSFPCIEQHSYVWVWMGSGKPNPATPPAIPGFDEHAWEQGVYSYDCEAFRLIENQFDACHPTFTHVNSHPAYFAHRSAGFREYDFEVRTTDTGLVSFYPPTASPDEPMPVKASSWTTFDLPGRVVVYQRAFFIEFCSILHIVQTGPSSCRLEWLQRKRGEPSLTWVEEEPLIATQDRIIESSQRWYDLCGDGFERSVEADYPTLLIRKIFHQALAGTWPAERDRFADRRLVHLRN